MWGEPQSGQCSGSSSPLPQHLSYSAGTLYCSDWCPSLSASLKQTLPKSPPASKCQHKEPPGPCAHSEQQPSEPHKSHPWPQHCRWITLSFQSWERGVCRGQVWPLLLDMTDSMTPLDQSHRCPLPSPTGSEPRVVLNKNQWRFFFHLSAGLNIVKITTWKRWEIS